jgi:hypothetical protein
MRVNDENGKPRLRVEGQDLLYPALLLSRLLPTLAHIASSVCSVMLFASYLGAGARL